MKKIILAIFALLSFVSADMKNIVVNKALLSKPMKIIDIRTPAEWSKTGIISGAYTIMFFDEKGNMKTDAFEAKLRKIVKKNEPFALVCQTGTRTALAAQFLSEERGYENVTNLQGGMSKLMREGYKTTPYRGR
jgi:rhodanese-related sulfurtransferase